MSCMEEMYGPDGVDSCMVVGCEVMYCSEGGRIVYGGEMRGRVWDTCMEQRVPCMEHVVPVLYETGGDRQYM